MNFSIFLHVNNKLENKDELYFFTHFYSKDEAKDYISNLINKRYDVAWNCSWGSLQYLGPTYLTAISFNKKIWESRTYLIKAYIVDNHVISLYKKKYVDYIKRLFYIIG